MQIYEHIGRLFANSYGPTVFELGAHVGRDTVAMLEIFHAPTYYLVEPDSRNIAALVEAGLHRRTHVIPAAIGGSDGVATLFQSTRSSPEGPPTYSGSSSIHQPKEHLAIFPAVTFESSEQVRVVTLDRLYAANGIEHVDFIWADIQGAEGDLINGGRNALRRTSYLYTEYSDKELYEGEWNLSRILAELPGWEVIERYPSDVLLRNTPYLRDRAALG